MVQATHPRGERRRDYDDRRRVRGRDGGLQARGRQRHRRQHVSALRDRLGQNVGGRDHQSGARGHAEKCEDANAGGLPQAGQSHGQGPHGVPRPSGQERRRQRQVAGQNSQAQGADRQGQDLPADGDAKRLSGERPRKSLAKQGDDHAPVDEEAGRDRRGQSEHETQPAVHPPRIGRRRESDVTLLLGAKALGRETPPPGGFIKARGGARSRGSGAGRT